ncbi:MAG: MBL fold metallo-hydrolase [Candidatus Hodarchaeales archaeon]|jgi:glyoxylase-like metal-dependent hydrolase (beta-lactamase superfamily II)
MSELTQFNLEFPTERTVAVLPSAYSNAGMVALRNFIVAIDPTMLPLTAREAREQVEAHFGLPTKYLFLTHCHGDHYFGLASYRDTVIISSTPLIDNVLKSKNERWTMEYFAEAKANNPEGAYLFDEIDISILPAVSFENAIEIRDDDLVVELHYAGGHTSGSGYAYVPHEKVLFAGDLIFSRRFPFAGDPTCNPDRWIKVFQGFQELEFNALIPGHGPVVTKSEVQTYLTFFLKLKEATQEAIDQGTGAKGIVIPEFYEDQSHELWFTEATLDRWYTFYEKKQA